LRKAVGIKKNKKKHLFAQLEIYKMQICQASDFFFS